MAHIQNLASDDDETSTTLGTSYSTLDSSLEDVKPDLRLLGQLVSGPPADSSSNQPAQEEEDSCEDETLLQQPQSGSAPGGPSSSSNKKSKKGSKKGGPKGIKGAAGDDSFTIATLSAGRGQKKVQPAHLTSSLLEEVLNEKKMALLQSPEVIEQLQMLQEDVKVTRQQQRTQEKHKPTSSSRVENKPKMVVDKGRSSSRHGHSETPSGRQSHHSTTGINTTTVAPTTSISSKITNTTCASTASSGTSIIWSKEGSAFTSVAGTSTPGSNPDNT